MAVVAHSVSLFYYYVLVHALEFTIAPTFRHKSCEDESTVINLVCLVNAVIKVRDRFQLLLVFNKHT